MSDVQKSKKVSDVHSQKHEDKPAQSISSLSSNMEYFQKQWDRFQLEMEDT